ncbi:hypothetical protein BZG36_05696 [Bifiguratus adelaidae]|uniref:Uncharacterized protein n=1 Tax=Bifiguratus adelaidae TaxID=1938954 RepID=A0A261XU25_9FUNG|nr:hypothetical protein BZG36_05696 [Bifiguratus adelaidae]
MGAKKVPAEFEEIEVQSIRAGRKMGLCTLNELRRFFHLKEYESYREMVTTPGLPPDEIVIKELEKHYGKDGINKVELYPGVVIEAAKNDGLSLPYTSSRAILADATNLLRNDRFYVDGINPHDLTTWGYEYANSGGSVFSKMILNCLPEWKEVVGKQAEELLISPFKVPNM